MAASCHAKVNKSMAGPDFRFQITCFTISDVAAGEFGLGIQFTAAYIFVVRRMQGRAVDAAAGFKADIVKRYFDGRDDFVLVAAACKGHGRRNTVAALSIVKRQIAAIQRLARRRRL